MLHVHCWALLGLSPAPFGGHYIVKKTSTYSYILEPP